MFKFLKIEHTTVYLIKKVSDDECFYFEVN